MFMDRVRLDLIWLCYYQLKAMLTRVSLLIVILSEDTSPEASGLSITGSIAAKYSGREIVLSNFHSQAGLYKLDGIILRRIKI